MKNKTYVTGYIPEEDEFLLKTSGEKGFLTKLNKDKTVPKAFLEWPRYSSSTDGIVIFKESFRKGWKIKSWRFGKSQNWATMVHPQGFTVEIYLQQLLELIKNSSIVDGELIGEFKWDSHNLIKK